MLARESLTVGDDCLRWWSNAASLATPGAPVVLAGVAGPLAHALATWKQPEYARAQLVDRRTLRFPPAVRVATVTGTPKAVEEAVASLTSGTFIDVLGPTPVESARTPRRGAVASDAVRAIVRFEYTQGSAVATALRSAIIRSAAKGRRPRGDRGYRPPPTLRVRLDDPEIS
jgi:primosomal protein N' (replication factor Y)